MTIAPPRGPTWKCCLGPQVLFLDLIYPWERSLSKPQVGGRWKGDIRLCCNGKLLLNKFWVNEAWELTLWNIAGFLRLLCDEGEGTQSH